MAPDIHTRSIAKAISQRVTGVVDASLISRLITREFEFGLSIGPVELLNRTSPAAAANGGGTGFPSAV
jgi:hypothetical protein